jgi:hypothetical protein
MKLGMLTMNSAAPVSSWLPCLTASTAVAATSPTSSTSNEQCNLGDVCYGIGTTDGRERSMGPAVKAVIKMGVDVA